MKSLQQYIFELKADTYRSARDKAYSRDGGWGRSQKFADAAVNARYEEICDKLEKMGYDDIQGDEAPKGKGVYAGAIKNSADTITDVYYIGVTINSLGDIKEYVFRDVDANDLFTMKCDTIGEWSFDVPTRQTNRKLVNNIVKYAKELVPSIDVTKDNLLKIE